MVFLVLFVLTAAFLIAVRYPAFQTFLAQRATTLLSNTLQTKVSVEKVEISFFNKADFVNFYMEDYNHDTLIYAKELKISFGLFQLLNKKVQIKSVMLDHGILHLHRDSTGQILNIAQVFDKLKSNKAQPVKTKEGVSWDIDLDEFNLNGTDFRYNDEKTHLDIKILLPTCNIAMNNMDLKKNIVWIKSLKIDKANIAFDLAKRPKAPDDTASAFHFLLNGPVVKFDELAISNSTFRLDDHNNDTILPAGTDFKHLLVSDINLKATKGSVIADTVIAEIKWLKAKERSGFILSDLTTKARVSTNEIVLDKLHIKTPHSEIKNFLSFRYNGFADFKEFLNNVRLSAKLDNSKLSVKDLNYFVHKLDKFAHNEIVLNGEIDGRVNNLKGRGLEIRTGQSTIFQGDFYTRGLPNIYETSLNLRLNRLATTAEDIKHIYPAAVLPENLNRLGLIYYSGSLDGFLTDFVSKGKLVTSIGSADMDLNFKYDKERNKASYKGDLALNEFNLGKYFNDEQLLGSISLTTKIQGKGLTLQSLDAQLDGLISSVTLKGYQYRDVQIKGSVLKKSFNGILAVHDKNLDVDFNGKADISKDVPEFNFDAVIRKADLKSLNLVKDDIRIAGDIKSNFRGNKIDNLVGSIGLNNVVLQRDSITADVKQLLLDTRTVNNGKKTITLKSDFAEGELTGNFTFTQLPKALYNFGRFMLTKNFVDTSAATTAQDFSLDLSIYDPGNVTQIIHPKFKKLEKTRVTGDFNTVNHKLNLGLQSERISFSGFDFEQSNINAAFENGSINFHSYIDKVYNGDSLMLDSVSLASKTINKDIQVDFHAADKNNYNYASIGALITPLEGKALVRLDPSDVKLGLNNWHFNKDNLIFLEGKKITSNNIIFKTTDQTLYISSYLKNDTSTSIKATLDNTNIPDFAKIFTTKVKDVYGAVNGSLVVEDIFYKPQVFANLVVNDLTIGKELIGDVDVESELDSAGKKLLLKASVKSINNNLDASGYVSIDASKPGLDIDIKSSHLGLNFLNYKFFDRYVKNCRGYAMLDAKVYGTLKYPLLKGKINLVNDTVTVSFLNTTYHLHNQVATLDEHGFDLSNLHIYDIKNNEIETYGNSRINHESFRDFALDIKVVARNAQFLNTTPKESPNFYGVAYGDGNVVFQGPINSPIITANATTRAGTYCKLPILSSYETNRYTYYKFLGRGRDTVTVIKPPQLKLNGVTFTLNLDVTPDARMDVILDPRTGDVLTGYGSGSLRINIPRNGNTNIRGDYTVERGNYTFTLQNIITKKFDIRSGGTVSFNGDVYKAKLNIDAVYEVRTSVSDLIEDMIGAANPNGGTNQLLSAAQTRTPVQLYLNLTGILEKPTIGFDIKANDVDPTIKSYVEQRLNLLKSNEGELYKQVMGLLVMNRFLPPQSTSNSIANANNLGGTAANTVSEFLSSQLSNYLSNLLEFANVRNLDVNIGYRQYDQTYPATQSGGSSQSAFDTRRELQLALSQRLLNNRLRISAGGNLDFGSSTVVTDPQTGLPIAGASNKSVIPTGDFQVEYTLTADGAWRVKAFNRTGYDYLNSRNNNRTGIGISYRQEFDKPSELFQKKTKPKKKANPNTPELKKEESQK